MFCHISSVPTTQQSRLTNGDIKNNIREHRHGVVMATRIPICPLLHTLPSSSVLLGAMDIWREKNQYVSQFFLMADKKYVDWNWTFH